MFSRRAGIPRKKGISSLALLLQAFVKRFLAHIADTTGKYLMLCCVAGDNSKGSGMWACGFATEKYLTKMFLAREKTRDASLQGASIQQEETRSDLQPSKKFNLLSSKRNFPFYVCVYESWRLFSSEISRSGAQAVFFF